MIPSVESQQTCPLLSKFMPLARLSMFRGRFEASAEYPKTLHAKFPTLAKHLLSQASTAAVAVGTK